MPVKRVTWESNKSSIFIKLASEIRINKGFLVVSTENQHIRFIFFDNELLMNIFFQYKKPGVIGPAIEPVLLELKSRPVNVAELISFMVEKIVEEYNRKPKNKPEDTSVSVSPREEPDIQNLATTGKIAFGLIYNERLVSTEQAVKTALSGYEDGLFKIFLNGEMLGNLDSGISINEGDLLTVVRLTFLSGRII